MLNMQEYLRDVTLEQQDCWRFGASGMWQSVMQVEPTVSKDSEAFIFKDKQPKKAMKMKALWSF